MLLTENQGISQEQWNKIAHILDFSEMVRFASGSGSAPSSEIQAIPEMIAETQKLCGEISGKKL